jgi:hypothetical protein
MDHNQELRKEKKDESHCYNYHDPVWCPAGIFNNDVISSCKPLVLEGVPKKPEWRCEWHCSCGVLHKHIDSSCACGKGVNDAKAFYWPWGPGEDVAPDAATASTR